MGKILKFTKPSGNSEFDHMLIGFYEAIELLVPVNQPGILHVEIKETGLVLTPIATRGGGAATTGMIHRGEWSSTVQYAYQNVVSRGMLGEFVVLQAGPTVGVPPETGAPYWHGWSWPAPGSWA